MGSYNISKFEGVRKFDEPDKPYFEYIAELENKGVSTKEIVYNFPLFVGHVNLSRYLFFYELYKSVLNLNGHIAEVGTFKGASLMFWAKMVKTFEPYNTTQVYGFDWFEGMHTGESDDASNNGLYKGSYEDLIELIHLQNLESIALVEKMDVTKKIGEFLDSRPHLRFKVIFIDCGIEEVMEASLKHLYPRLVQGGVLIMDHYNMEVSPTESDVLEKYIGNQKVMQMPFNRHSSGYVIKGV